MKKIIILVLLAFMAFLILHSQYFDYSEPLSGFNIPSEIKSTFAGGLSLIVLILSALIYGGIIQKLTKEGFKKSLYLTAPLLFAIALVFIINSIYFLVNEEFFCMWSCGRGYDFSKDFIGIFYFYGVIGLSYGVARLGLQQKFLNFFQSVSSKVSIFTEKRGALIIGLLLAISTLFILFTVIDHASYGEKFHLSNDPGFEYHWEDVAIENNDIKICEKILENSQDYCFGKYEGERLVRTCGHINICISAVLEKRVQMFEYDKQALLNECKLLEKENYDFCNEYVSENWKNNEIKI